MSAIEKLLTDHIDIWTAAETEKKSGRGRSSGNAGSVYGIKKLRELILELAVRGKLVPQDENDEPAGELLQRVNRELCNSINSTCLPKLHRDKSTFDPIDFHFDIPDLWVWCELQEIAIFENGKAHEQFVTENKTFVLVNSSFISNNGDKVKYVSERLSPLFKDDIAIVMSDVPAGRALVRCFLVEDNDKFTLNQRIGALKTGSILSKRYLLMVLDRNKYYIQYDDGKKQTNLKKIQILSCPIPLPPLAEQHRIVAKVDELMALCDQLETQHSNAAEAHEKLVNHLLGTLTQSPVRGELVEPHPSTSSGRTEFEDSWQRIAAHFDTLFTTEASIDALKQTLLQLAVMGKLVPQDPNDEPASELLKRIQAEKTKLVAEGKIKKDKSLSLISKDEQPFELPPNWEWARFPELGEFGRGKSKHRPRNDPKLFNPGIYPLVQTGEVARAANVIHEYHSKYSEIGLAQSRMWPAGTLCITIAANIADSALLGFDACFPDSVVGFVPFQPLNDTKYFLAFMKTARENLLKFAPATAQKNINLEILESVLIPLPPLKEISRIVAKVDELMSLCDQLKTRITQAKQLQQKLADVLVEQAVSQ